MTLWLALRLAPVTRRLIVPELSTAGYRDEVRSGDRGLWLRDAGAAWLVATCMALVGSFLAPPLVSLLSVTNNVARTLVGVAAVCLVPFVLYGLGSGLRQIQHPSRRT